jgi:hypothetical protein
MRRCGLAARTGAHVKNNWEESMLTSWMQRCYWLVALVVAMAVSVGSAKAPAPDLNPAAISYKLPNQINWVHAPNGSDSAVLAGDPSKPGMYIVLTRWTAHHMSHPHWHPNDRYITVISGTWWVGTGTKYDPDSTFPLPPGTVVTHFGKQVHYDGAKDEDVTLVIAGDGPATQTPAEVK